MKQYCKRVNVRSIYFIKHCIYACLDGKWKRRDVHDLLAQFCDWDRGEIEKCATDIGRRKELAPVIDALALHIQSCIKARKLILSRTRNRMINDGISKKRRKIAIAAILHQIYDYIVKDGLQELFRAKIAPHQYATIKGRGQSYGKKYNQKWMRAQKVTYRGGKPIASKAESTCAFDADVRKCYPSVSIGKLKAFLHRDVRNPELLWLADTLIDKMTREQYNLRGDKVLRGKQLHFATGAGLRGQRVKRGISIGSVLSCYLMNYLMSYAWRYAQQLCRWETRKSKDGKSSRVRMRLITHCGIYMDNITVYGKNKRDLGTAQRMLEIFMRRVLGMHLKPDWRKYRLDYTDKKGKRHGSPVDSMGYVVHRDHTRMRGKIFLRARRRYAKLRKCQTKKRKPSKHLCGGIISYNGWFKAIDARQWQRKNDFKHHISKIARRLMGAYMREENLRAKQDAIQRAAIAC